MQFFMLRVRVSWMVSADTGDEKAAVSFCEPFQEEEKRVRFFSRFVLLSLVPLEAAKGMYELACFFGAQFTRKQSRSSLQLLSGQCLSPTGLLVTFQNCTVVVQFSRLAIRLRPMLLMLAVEYCSRSVC